MRNPDWTRDELIVALDFYLRNRDKVPDKGSNAIQELSDNLNTLGRILFGSKDRDGKFRNINGVYMKLMNFRALDPNFTRSGRRGLTRGGSADELVWNELSSTPQTCRRAALSILKATNLLGAPPASSIAASSDVDTGLEDALEGRLLTRLHTVRERSRSLVRKKLMAVLYSTGKLACEICNFDFSEKYGDVGVGFAECHHTRPVSELGDGGRTKLSDLAVLCANCHRMIHRRRPWLSLAELKTIVLAKGANS